MTIFSTLGRLSTFMRISEYPRTHFGQVLEFIVGLTGFFAVITGFLLWLSHLEQTLHGPPPRTAPTGRYAFLPTRSSRRLRPVDGAVTTISAGPSERLYAGSNAVGRIAHTIAGLASYFVASTEAPCFGWASRA